MSDRPSGPVADRSWGFRTRAVIHLASTTHQQHSDDQLRVAGVPPDRARISVGIEDAEDILVDLDQAPDQALDAATPAGEGP